MPNGYVEYGRWDEANKALLSRLQSVEADVHGLTGASAEHQAMQDRITRLEQEERTEDAGARAKRERSWTIWLTIASCLIAPVLVATVVTWLHLKALH